MGLVALLNRPNIGRPPSSRFEGQDLPDPGRWTVGLQALGRGAQCFTGSTVRLICSNMTQHHIHLVWSCLQVLAQNIKKTTLALLYSRPILQKPWLFLWTVVVWNHGDYGCGNPGTGQPWCFPTENEENSKQ